MAVVVFGDRVANVKAVIFDKDGTLLDYRGAWPFIGRKRVQAIVGRLGLEGSFDSPGMAAKPLPNPPPNPSPKPLMGPLLWMEGRPGQGPLNWLEFELLRTIGVDPHTGFINPRAPLTIGPRYDTMIAASTVLFQRGYPWDVAKAICEEAFNDADAEIRKSVV